MKVLYVSPSSIPSKTANSIHVINMCKAFCQIDNDVTLIARRSIRSKDEFTKETNKNYGQLPIKLTLISYFSNSERMASLIIALIALKELLFGFSNKYNVIFSRNLYFAFFYSFLSKKSFFFETHNPEFGFRSRLQDYILKSPNVQTIVISKALKQILQDKHQIDGKNIHVLHDAAPDSISILSSLERKKIRQELFLEESTKKLVGYFGHLYRGRGFEIIESLSKMNPTADFFVFGGNEKEIQELKPLYQQTNLHIMGHIPHERSLLYMQAMDILLMPYQKKVYVDRNNSLDTSLWMSPMKMFEYMASNVPIISSQISVLEEVLENEKNCLMVEPADTQEWNQALNRIIIDPTLAINLAGNARKSYDTKYTWKQRAEFVVNYTKNLLAKEIL